MLVELGEEKVWRAIQIPAFADPLVPFPRLPLLLLVNPVLCRMAIPAAPKVRVHFSM